MERARTVLFDRRAVHNRRTRRLEIRLRDERGFAPVSFVPRSDGFDPINNSITGTRRTIRTGTRIRFGARSMDDRRIRRKRNNIRFIREPYEGEFL